MTGKTFRTQVYLTIGVLLAASMLTLWLGVQNERYGEASRTVIPVYIAVAAAWLTFCLQRRVAYINALRKLWEELVQTVRGAMSYASSKNPSEKEFNKLVREFGCRIDEVRGVFRNVAEIYLKPDARTKSFVRAVKHMESIDGLSEVLRDFSDNPTPRGLYPLESLKQMLGVIQKLGHGPAATPARGMIARKTIERLWQILRAELLKELDRDYPEFPDTPYSRPSRLGRAARRLWTAMSFRRGPDG